MSSPREDSPAAPATSAARADGRAVVLAITGIGGMGKTATVIEYAYATGPRPGSPRRRAFASCCGTAPVVGVLSVVVNKRPAT